MFGATPIAACYARNLLKGRRRWGSSQSIAVLYCSWAWNRNSVVNIRLCLLLDLQQTRQSTHHIFQKGFLWWFSRFHGFVMVFSRRNSIFLLRLVEPLHDHLSGHRWIQPLKTSMEMTSTSKWSEWNEKKQVIQKKNPQIQRKKHSFDFKKSQRKTTRTLQRSPEAAKPHGTWPNRSRRPRRYPRWTKTWPEKNKRFGAGDFKRFSSLKRVSEKSLGGLC